MDFSNKLKFLRKEKLNLNQKEFGEKIDVTRSTIKNWEVGTSNPTTSHIMMISYLCGVTSDYLIFDNHPLELSLLGIEDDEYNILSSLINYFTNINKEKK